MHPLSGSSRLYLIVGDPIAQVKSPAGVTAALQALGHDAWMLPAHVAPADFTTWFAGISTMRNCDGVLITVPHKFAAVAACATLSPRAKFLGTVNMLRCNADGTWHGDMSDGLGMLRALRDLGCAPAGLRALVVGAGGAGSAIAHALIEAGVRDLAIHDPDMNRRSALIARLQPVAPTTTIAHGSADPSGFDIVINASPMGMQSSDPLPCDVTRLTAQTWVGDVVTLPAIPPLIETARAIGCKAVTGTDMAASVGGLIVDFFLQPK